MWPLQRRLRFESEGVFVGCGLGGVGEGGDDGCAFITIAELVGVVAAAELTALATGDEHEGIIPIAGISDEAHRRSVMASGRAWTESGAVLRFAGDAEKSFEPTFAAERVEHVERIETLPGPVLDF